MGTISAYNEEQLALFRQEWLQEIMQANSQSRSTVRHRHVEHNVFDNPAPYHISDTYGEALDGILLEEIATLFSDVDEIFLGFLMYILNEKSTPESEVSESERESSLKRIMDLYSEIKSIKEGPNHFQESYLREKYMTEFWARSARCMFHYLRDAIDRGPDGQPVKDHYDRLFDRLERKSSELVEYLVLAVRTERMTKDEWAATGARMRSLDDIFDEFHSLRSTHRTSMRWPQIRRHIGLDRPGQLSDLTGSISRTVVFWSTILVAILLSSPLLAIAFKCSTTENGTVKDSDFWVLLQNGSMQLLNTSTAMLQVYRNKRLSRFTRNLMLTLLFAGVLCIVSALILYPLASKWWSALMNSFGVTIQAFVIVNILFETKGKTE